MNLSKRIYNKALVNLIVELHTRFFVVKTK